MTGDDVEYCTYSVQLTHMNKVTTKTIIHFHEYKTSATRFGHVTCYSHLEGAPIYREAQKNVYTLYSSISLE